MLIARMLVVLAIVAALVAGCRARTLPTSSNAPIEFRILDNAATLKENGAQLANFLICSDSLGRPMSADAAPLCVPCVPLSAFSNGPDALKHARRLWQLTAKTPYDDADNGAHCTRISYELALISDRRNREYRLEHALFQTASANDSIRALGLSTIDVMLDSMMRSADSAGVVTILDRTGTFIWQRAQRMRARSWIIDTDDREKSVHDLKRGAPSLRALPPLPSTSDSLGTSEALWASQLFREASAFTGDVARRAMLTRLSLAPYVVLGQWRVLDSTAQHILRKSPQDSVAFVAHALAVYELGKRSLASYSRIDATFDSALSALPAADSVAYDNVDEVFSAKDDEWRYGFLPGVRQQLDRRAWSIVDPLWSTPVNEIRLARRARKAEADFRHADIALPGQSGSETEPGVLLLKAGRPSSQWETWYSGPSYALQFGWSDYVHRLQLWRDDNAWRVFYGDMMSPQVFVRNVVDSSSRCPAAGVTLIQCAREQSARWNDVVFYARLDTIDVTLTRFRAPGDSVDLYIGSRLPLRGFRHRGSPGARLGDSVEYGFWVSTSLGRVLHHRETSRALPRESEIAWTGQWVSRVGDGNIMHRVEAIDRRYARGARGASLLTSAEAATFPLRGFGVSDILVADKVSATRPLLQSWRDLEIVPNGGVVAPHVPIALAWEIYDLARGADGRARWRVQLRREDGTMRSRFDAQSLIVGSPNAGTQVVASEPDASDISYVRTEPARPTTLEYLRFNLTDAQPGRHVLILEVEDLVAKKKTSRSVSLRILHPMAQNRSRDTLAQPDVNGFRLIDGNRQRRR